MKRATETTTFAFAAMLIAAGCAAARPATEDSEPEAVTTSDTLFGTITASQSAPGRKTCEPGATRECKTYWTDARGQLHCMVQGQVCRADGYAWQPCGELDAGQAPDGGSDDDDDASDSPLR